MLIKVVNRICAFLVLKHYFWCTKNIGSFDQNLSGLRKIIFSFTANLTANLVLILNMAIMFCRHNLTHYILDLPTTYVLKIYCSTTLGFQFPPSFI